MSKRRLGPVAPPENEDVFLAIEDKDGIAIGRRLAAIAKATPKGLDVVAEAIETTLPDPVWLRLYDDASGGEAIVEHLEPGGVKSGQPIRLLFVVDDPQ